MKRKAGRYWIFAFEGFYPKGGMNDYKFSFNTVEEFSDEILEHRENDGFQLLDTETNYDFQSDFGEMTKWVCKNIGGENYEEDIIR